MSIDLTKAVNGAWRSSLTLGSLESQVIDSEALAARVIRRIVRKGAGTRVLNPSSDSTLYFANLLPPYPR